MLLLPIILFFSEGCYTQFVTQETEITVPDSATVNVTNNYDVDVYAGYGYRYTGLDYYGGYQPYWYDNYYTPYYNPYRAYIYPFRPFAHRPAIIHKPIWRMPFGKEPRKHFGTNWQILKPTNPPKHGRDIGQPKGPGRESVRSVIIKREAPQTRFGTQRVQMPARSPQVRDMRQGNSGQRNNYTPMSRGNERNYPMQRQTYTPPAPQTHSAPAAPAPSSGGNRSSGATRSGKDR